MAWAWVVAGNSFIWFGRRDTVVSEAFFSSILHKHWDKVSWSEKGITSGLSRSSDSLASLASRRLLSRNVRLIMRRSKTIGAVVACALLLLGGGVAGAADAVRVAGVYSNLHYNKEGGDLLGAEVLIFPANASNGFSALVQLAEGGAPFAALVSVIVTGSKVEFTIPEGGPYGGLRFSGTVSRTELVGRWSSGSAFGGGERERLKRGKSYWQ